MFFYIDSDWFVVHTLHDVAVVASQAGGPTADRTGEPKILRGPDAQRPQVDSGCSGCSGWVYYINLYQGSLCKTTMICMDYFRFIEIGSDFYAVSKESVTAWNILKLPSSGRTTLVTFFKSPKHFQVIILFVEGHSHRWIRWSIESQMDSIWAIKNAPVDWV